MSTLNYKINESAFGLQGSNDIKAFDDLFHEYANKLYRFSFSLLKNEEDSKEIVQETFCRIWDRRKEIDTSTSLKSFIFTISYHLIIDRLRLCIKDREYRKFLHEYFRENPAKDNVQMDYHTIQQEINKAVEELPDRRKQIYLLSREKGFSHKKIAALLNIKEKTVENHINLALRQIKFRLGKDILAIMLFLALYG